MYKAVSEDGERLHIRKANLRAWRTEFARHLRALGISANASPRYVRGETRPRRLDGTYRASLRGASTQMRKRAEDVAMKLAAGKLPAEPGKAELLRTRKELTRAWQAVGDILIREGQLELAASVRKFTDHMPVPMTENEAIAADLLSRCAGRHPIYGER